MAGRERQFEDAVSAGVADFTIGNRKAERVMAAATRPDYDLANASVRLGMPLRILRRKALVGMFMTHQEQGSVRGVQILPKFFQLRVDGMTLEQAAAEERLMGVSEDA